MKKFHFNTYKIIGYTLFILFCAIIMAFSIRGLPGNPNASQLSQLKWTDNGPLELSPERGRFALTYSIIENHSFQFTPDIARFAAPDVGYLNGKYVSLFAPGVSFVVIPGYIVGKMLGYSQIGSFAVIALFAILNVLLIRAIAVKLGMRSLAGLIAGLTFLFATPAFPYAVTLYQHHISTFLVLLGIYLLISFDSIWSLIIIWILCGLSISIDYPNFFLMLPIGLAGLGRTFKITKEHFQISLKIPVLRVVAMGSIILPLLFFLWFNYASNGSPFQLSGTVDRSLVVKANGQPELESKEILQRLKASGQPVVLPKKSALGAFNNRNIFNGMYEFFVSPDRSMLYFTPVMFFGFIGLWLAVRKKMPYAWLLFAIIGFDILLYSMWDDPYGGWAFGARYLIPVYAVLALFIAYLLSRIVRYNLLLLLFFTVLTYSVGVNTLGALTSNRNPPKVEAVALAKTTNTPQPYTFVRNINVLNADISKSFVFETEAKYYMTAWNYYTYVASFIVIVCAFLLITYKATAKGVRREV